MLGGAGRPVPLWQTTGLEAPFSGMASGGRWHIKAKVGFVFFLILWVWNQTKPSSSCTYFLQPWPFKKCRSTRFLQPIQNTFPFTSLLAAGQQCPHTQVCWLLDTQLSSAGVFSEFSLLSSCFQSRDGEGPFLDTGQHGGGEDLL